MSRRHAKVLSPHMLIGARARIRRSSDPDRGLVILLLSVKAGLRACEIAGLEWPMVLDARGRIGPVIELHDRIAKMGLGRRIPMHPELKAALLPLLRNSDRKGPIIRSNRQAAMQPNSIVNWFVSLYAELGFEGCSSHSGRRTFITAAARGIAKAGGSLRDVQLLAGHRSIETTQIYIEGDTDAQRRLVSLI